MGDLFRLQDDIARRVVGSAVAAAVGRHAPPTPDAPHDARAYELYLRAQRARSHLRRASGRARLVSALPRAGSAVRAGVGAPRPLPPRDRQVHRGRARQRDARRGRLPPRARARARSCRSRTSSTRTSRPTSVRRTRALVRLLGEASRHGNDPELFAGLVHACRYCGLYEQSIAAHAEARRLDPNVPTSFEQTLLMAGDIDRLLAIEPPRLIAGADDGIRVIGLGLAGRRDEARQRLLAMRRSSRIPTFQSWIEYLMAWLDRRPADMAVRLSATQRVEDPGRSRGDLPGGLAAVRRRRARGRARLSAARGREGLLRRRRRSRAGRSSTRCGAIPRSARCWQEAEAGRQRALAAFREAGGERLIDRKRPASAPAVPAQAVPETHEDSRAGAMQGGDCPQAENAAAGEPPPLGTDVGASDGLPSQRRLPHGDRAEAGQRRQRPAAAHVGEVDRAVPAAAVAAWHSRRARKSISSPREPGRATLPRTSPSSRRSSSSWRRGRRVRLAGASDLRQDVTRRLAPLGATCTWTITCVSSAPEKLQAGPYALTGRLI